MASKKTEKTYTAQDLAKAIDDSYSLGFKHGSARATPPVALPSLNAEIQITSLAKSIGDSSRQTQKVILQRHKEAVEKHMKAWAADKEKAMAELLEAAKQHKVGGHDHGH